MCGMEASRRKKGRYEPSTSFTEIEVSRRDTYDMLAHKSAFAVGLLDKEELALYRPAAGVRIANEDITLKDGAKVPWTIGAYLRRARKCAEKVSFGVGVSLQTQVQNMLQQDSKASVFFNSIAIESNYSIQPFQCIGE